MSVIDLFKTDPSVLSDEEKKELEDMVIKARDWSCEETVRALTLGEFGFLISPMRHTRYYLDEMRKITKKVNVISL